MAVTTTTAIILGAGAILGTGAGIAKGVADKKQAGRNADLLNKQAGFAAQERMRQADKLKSMQKVSYLKSGVLLSGTPELVMNETMDFAQADARQIFRTKDIQTRNLQSAAKTGMFTNTLQGLSSGLGLGMKGAGF